MRVLPILITLLRSAFRSRAAVELENLALRHQVNVLKRSVKHRPKVTPADRLLWLILSRVWSDWRSALAIVQPETVIAWLAKAFACSGHGVGQHRHYCSCRRREDVVTQTTKGGGSIPSGSSASR